MAVRTEPISITVAVSGVKPPPPASTLADQLGEAFDHDVQVEIAYWPIEIGITGGP